MNWIIARLREDNTRSAIGQLALVVLVIALLLGVDVNALLTQAEANLSRIGAIIAGGIAIWVQVQRIVTPQPPDVPALPEVAKAVGQQVEDKLRQVLPEDLQR